MALEGFSRKLDAKMNPRPAAPEPAEETGSARLTLEQIRAQKDKEFAAFIETEGKAKTMEGVWSRYLEKTSTPKDLDVLTGLVDRFNHQTEEAERVCRTFDDYLPEIAAASPEYAKYAKAFGDDRLKEVIKKGILEFTYSDRKKYDAIDKKFIELEKLNAQERTLNKFVEDFCEKHHVIDDELVEAMQHKDMDERQRAIQLLIRHRMTFWERFKDDVRNHTIQGGTRSHARGMASRHGEFVRVEKSKDQFLKDAGSSLAALVSKNEMLRNALLHADVGEEVEITEGIQAQMGMEEAREAAKDTASFEEYAAKFKEERIPNWDNMTDDQQDRAFETAWSSYAREAKKKMPSGFWSVVSLILFGKRKEEMRSVFKKAKTKQHE